MLAPIHPNNTLTHEPPDTTTHEQNDTNQHQLHENQIGRCGDYTYEIPVPKPNKKQKKKDTQISDWTPKRAKIKQQQFVYDMIIQKKRQQDNFPDHPI